MRVTALKHMLIAVVVAPLSTALLFGLIALADGPDQFGVMIAGAGAIIFYALALGVTLVLLLPLNLALPRMSGSVTRNAIVGGVASIVLFIAFSLFTGDFGPPREWVWVPLYGGVLGAAFAALVQRGDLRD